MIGALFMRGCEFVGVHFGAAICLGLGLSALGLFFALALLRGGK